MAHSSTISLCHHSLQVRAHTANAEATKIHVTEGMRWTLEPGALHPTRPPPAPATAYKSSLLRTCIIFCCHALENTYHEGIETVIRKGGWHDN